MSNALGDEEPLLGLQIVDYDEATKTVTIELNNTLLLTLAQQEAIINRLIECRNRGPINIVTRTVVDEQRRIIRSVLSNDAIWKA
jgi:hypothetical protein